MTHPNNISYSPWSLPQGYSNPAASSSGAAATSNATSASHQQDALPPGWVACQLPQSQRIYYSRSGTNHTQWDRPRHLMPGWIEVLDNQQLAYFNTSTRQSTSVRPEAPPQGTVHSPTAVQLSAVQHTHPVSTVWLQKFSTVDPDIVKALSHHIYEGGLALVAYGTRGKPSFHFSEEDSDVIAFFGECNQTHAMRAPFKYFECEVDGQDGPSSYLINMNFLRDEVREELPYLYHTSGLPTGTHPDVVLNNYVIPQMEDLDPNEDEAPVFSSIVLGIGRSAGEAYLAAQDDSDVAEALDESNDRISNSISQGKQGYLARVNNNHAVFPSIPDFKKDNSAGTLARVNRLFDACVNMHKLWNNLIDQHGHHYANLSDGNDRVVLAAFFSKLYS